MRRGRRPGGRQQDGSWIFYLPTDLGDELSALAAFGGTTVIEVVRKFVHIGLLVAKHEDIVLCRVDEAGIHTEIDLEEEDTWGT